MTLTGLILLPLPLWVAQAPVSPAVPQKSKIVFIAGPPSHGPGMHDHPAGCELLANCLNAGQLDVLALVSQGWPQDEHIFDGAKAVVVYSDGGGGHPLLPHLQAMDALAKKGVGIALLHYAVEPVPGDASKKFLDWIGGYFEINYSVNPHWDAEITALPSHPATRGVQPFSMADEWYYHMRFVPDMKGVTPILTARPPASTLDREEGTHSNNPQVKEDVLVKKEPQHLAWAYVRQDGGRGFGFTGGHFHEGWKNDQVRRLVLNAICWTAGVDVPDTGVPCGL